MPRHRSALVLIARVIAALVLLGIAVLLAMLGGFLNRCRGGYVHIGPNLNSSDNSSAIEWYWPAHILSRLLFAVPTGMLVLIFSLHLRMSLIVTVMTWFSLYVGWGSYMVIGMSDNYCSRPGVFDWLVGRQGLDWTFHQRFVREYAAMSLRGLIWTAPQGYALEQLGFGWEYSLSGSLMGLVYYIGFNINLNYHSEKITRMAGGSIPTSECTWGFLIWFILIICCLAQLVRRARIWVYRKNPHIPGIRPYTFFEIVMYKSLNRPYFRGLYDAFMIILSLIYCFSLIYYSLIKQKDRSNKGQTFFGLFTGILLLIFCHGWVWGIRYLEFRLRKIARNIRQRGGRIEAGFSNEVLSNGGRYSNAQLARAAVLNRTSNLDHYQSAPRSRSSSSSPNPRNSERQPLLSWPYSHPDRLSPTASGTPTQQTLNLPEGSGGNSTENPATQVILNSNLQNSSSRRTLLALWTFIEGCVWMDLFIVVRRFIGIVSLLSTILTFFMLSVAVVWGWDCPRFMSQLAHDCPNV